jgi:hypothetical protein
MTLRFENTMPSSAGALQRLDVVTGPFTCVRLLGNREAVDALTPTLGHIVIDRGAQVPADARAIRVFRQRVPVVAFVNNHFAGYAPGTVRHVTLRGALNLGEDSFVPGYDGQASTWRGGRAGIHQDDLPRSSCSAT